MSEIAGIKKQTLGQQFNVVFEVMRELMKPESNQSRPIGFIWNNEDAKNKKGTEP